MLKLFSLVILFSLFTAVSVLLTGDRSLISGNLAGINLLNMMFNWRFIVAMVLAVGSRFAFIFINNHLLSIPSLSKNSTTITAFITSFSYIFIIAANYIFLNERLSPAQIAGAVMIIGGILLII
jgi:drug/metabolite transporter (DMT)-like permease